MEREKPFHHIKAEQHKQEEKTDQNHPKELKATPNE